MSCPHRARPPRHQAGLSLVELLLALAITALVMVPLLELLRTTAATSRHVTPRYELQREASFALQRIAAQVRNGVPISSYSLDGTGKLVETNGAVVSTLAESVTVFNKSTPPSATGQQLVQVSLTLVRDGISATADATIRFGGQR